MNVRTVQSCNGEKTIIEKFKNGLLQSRYYGVLQTIWTGLFDGIFFFLLYFFNGIGY